MLRIAPLPLPDAAAATEPAEERGTGRDDVRLMVSRTGARPDHHRFADFPSMLAPGRRTRGQHLGDTAGSARGGDC